MVGIDEMGGQGKVILLDLCIISLCIISQVCIVFIIKKIPYNKFDYRTSAIPHMIIPLLGNLCLALIPISYTIPTMLLFMGCCKLV